jgi:hypothetical protein
MGFSVRSVPEVPLCTYAEVRPRIRSGDLLLCAGSSLVSRLIQRATDSVWSHVAMIVRVEAIDRLMVLESVESIGVRCVPLSRYVGDHNGTGRPYAGELVIARHDAFERVAPLRVRSMAQFAVDLLSRPYDKHEIVRIAMRIALGDRRASDPTLPRDDAYICSEYVWECCRAAGIAIAPDHRGFIAPRDFAVDPNVHALCRLRTACP